MRKSGWRLALSAALFAGWIGYLAYLSATTTHPIVLSRPQFLAADFYVVAEVPADPAAPDEPASVVTVKQVVWSARSEDSKLTAIEVLNLNAKHGWEGAGEYIMPLSRTKDAKRFRVTSIPRTPGFGGDVGRIYQATPTTLRQLELLNEEYHAEK
jgi:hypothetical protein